MPALNADFVSAIDGKNGSSSHNVSSVIVLDVVRARIKLAFNAENPLYKIRFSDTTTENVGVCKSRRVILRHSAQVVLSEFLQCDPIVQYGTPLWLFICSS